MKLHMKELSRAFLRTEASETTPTEGVNSYLLEEVLRPTLRGNPPRLRSIDYDQFTEDDLYALADYYEQLERTCIKLSQFVGAVSAIGATPCRIRQFC